MTTEQATKLGEEHGKLDSPAKVDDDWSPEVKQAYLASYCETVGQRGYQLLDWFGDAQDLAERLEHDPDAKLIDRGEIIRHGRF